MVEATKYQIWRRRFQYFLICIALIFFHMIPLDLVPNRMAPPDLMLCITLAVAVRRAIFVPYWLVGSLFLFADLMLSRPLGLWAFLALAMSEVVRSNRFVFREMFFLTEWLLISIIMTFMVLMMQFVLTFALAPGLPGIGLLWQLVFTILAYPLVVLIISEWFGIRKPSAMEYNTLGNRA